ncbi:hypothetical protein [Leuconostoc citreum]|uniref:hypothetical protein n=1 Tax=Leuconostoc citreum TaxID=33964 RepID=UPI00191025A9|nr:hypothetical protein [Leuconostoc citreum]QQE97698.1 hypothetical protein LeuC0096_05930 [Leuconostoc citreum]
MNIRKPRLIIKIWFFLFIFWGIYTPVANIIGPEITAISFVFFDFILLLLAIITRINLFYLLETSKIFFLMIAIFLASIYVGFRSSLSGNDTRLFQNLQIELQIVFFFLILVLMYYRFGFTKFDILKLFLDVAFFQSVVSIFMLLSPALHNIALNLYYAGRPENVFINAKRIYGFSSEYTFTTPIVNGILGVISVFLTIKKSKFFLIYLLPILLLVLLNGRTGLVIFFVGTMIVIIKNSKNIFRLCILLVISILGIGFSFYSLSILSPDTFTWIISFFDDTSNLLNGNLTGNYAELGMQYPFQNLLFGYGFRIYDLNSIVSNITILTRSDIGYANDLFLGGVVYIVLLYIPILLYVYNSDKQDNNFKRSGISLFFVIAMLIADYKGEAMRNGNLLLMVVTLAMLIRIPKNMKLEEQTYGKL